MSITRDLSLESQNIALKMKQDIYQEFIPIKSDLEDLHKLKSELYRIEKGIKGSLANLDKKNLTDYQIYTDKIGGL